jgi:hypothetical protein
LFWVALETKINLQHFAATITVSSMDILSKHSSDISKLFTPSLENSRKPSSSSFGSFHYNRDLFHWRQYLSILRATCIGLSFSSIVLEHCYGPWQLLVSIWLVICLLWLRVFFHSLSRQMVGWYHSHCILQLLCFSFAIYACT